MGSMLGLPGAMAAGGLSLTHSAMNARTRTGGVASGIAGGALTGAAIGSIIPGVGTAAGLIVGAIVGTIAGGVGGWFKGGANEDRLHESGEKLANEIVDGLLDSIDTATSRESIEDIVKGYDELLANDTLLTDMAKQEGVSKSALVAKLLDRRDDLGDHVVNTFALIGESVEALGEITGESANLIQDNAKRWSIALQAGGQAIDDYIAERNIGFKHTTAAEIESLIHGANYDALMNSPMHIEHRTNLLALESKAATDAFFQSMQDTDDIDMDLLDAYLKTGLAEVAALDLTATEQAAMIGRVLANMQANAARYGYVIDPAKIGQVQSDYGVTEGGTGQGFVDKSFEEFKKTNYYAQNLIERGGSAGYTKEEIAEDHWAMYNAADGAEQMKIFNDRIWSKEMDALIEHKNELVLDTEALKGFREQLEAGTYVPPPAPVDVTRTQRHYDAERLSEGLESGELTPAQFEYLELMLEQRG